MSEEVEPQDSGPDRRSIMKAAALVALPVAGVGAVAACASQSSSGGSSGGAHSGNGSVSVPSASVPVGGGFIDRSSNVVVTQPEAGVYKAFTAICTHQGCTVASVTNNRILCPCHGSVFNGTDGSVIRGPAAAPLTAMPATVTGSNVVVSES